MAILQAQAAAADSRHLYEKEKQAKKLLEAQQKLEVLEKLLASSQEQLRAQQTQQRVRDKSSSEESDADGSNSEEGDASEEESDSDEDAAAAPGGEGDKVTWDKLVANLRNT